MHLSDLICRRAAAEAVVCTDGSGLSCEELDDLSRQLANVLAGRGCDPGSTIAFLLPNSARTLAVAWAAQRAGLHFVPVNRHLSVAEAAHIVRDSGAQALIAAEPVAELAADLVARLRATDGPEPTVRLSFGPVSGFEDLDSAADGVRPGVLDSAPRERPDPEPNGHYMFYSSGTTGAPKGIRRDLAAQPFGAAYPLEDMVARLYGFGPDTVYLSTGPLYHAAPLGWSMATTALGGRVVVMDRFDAQQCLAAIEHHRVTHVQFVPTMLVRLLKLPRDVRESYDVSSLRAVVHAAAPCPPEVKRRAIDWLGPIVHEYYAGSEGNCFFAIDTADWLAHPGSVGRSLQGTPHILDDDGHELDPGEVGQIWIEGEADFEYHNDPDKTSGSYNERGWSTLGDLGHLDAEGYLYLSDRRTDLIIRGGVNIYPREIEEALVSHPAVLDVAVVGVPDADMGEQVRAVVQVAPDAAEVPDDALAERLLAHCAERLAPFKRPRSIEFVDELPRLPSGKVLRRLLRDRAAERRDDHADHA
ncbi:AMP-binding protein [Jatrophihabitans fulvus]